MTAQLEWTLYDIWVNVSDVGTRSLLLVSGPYILFPQKIVSGCLAWTRTTDVERFVNYSLSAVRNSGRTWSWQLTILEDTQPCCACGWTENTRVQYFVTMVHTCGGRDGVCRDGDRGCNPHVSDVEVGWGTPLAAHRVVTHNLSPCRCLCIVLYLVVEAGASPHLYLYLDIF